MQKLYRTRWDRKFLGVIGGLGRYFSIDPNFLRMIFVFVLLGTMFVIPLVIYLILAALLPWGPSAYVMPNYKKLTRDSSNKKISGLCGGLGKYFDVDPILFRILFIGLLFWGVFPIVVTYIVSSAIIPEN